MFFIGNLLAGFATFAPKFIEAQFSLQASNAAQYVGKSWHNISVCWYVIMACNRFWREHQMESWKNSDKDWSPYLL